MQCSTSWATWTKIACGVTELYLLDYSHALSNKTEYILKTDEVEFSRGLSPRPFVHKYNPLTHRCTSETCLSLSEVLWWVRLLVYPFCDCSGHTVESLWFSRMSVEPIYQELFVKHGDEFRGMLLASRGIRFQPGFTSWAEQIERGRERERESKRERGQASLSALGFKVFWPCVFPINFYSPSTL